MLIGIGNLHRGDDGVGIVVARRIRDRSPALRVVESLGEGARLMDHWHSADVVILVDAVRSGSSPGHVHRLDARSERIPSDFFNYSTHAFSVAEAVELARTLGTLPAQLIIYGIEGKNFAAGNKLSAEISAVVEDVSNRILAELNTQEHDVPAEAQGMSHA